MYRRRLLGALAATGAVAVAGCLGGEDGSYEFDAEPASVPAGVLADAGYAGEEPEPFHVEQSVDLPGVEARVSVTTWVAGYENPERGAALFVASTPNATVAGQSVNPLVRAEPAELLRRLIDQGEGGPDGDDVDEIEERGTETRELLGQSVEVTTFEAQVDLDVDEEALADAEGVEGAEGLDDGEVPALVHVATVEHREDVIALVGVHPRAVDEAGTLLSLMEAVEH